MNIGRPGGTFPATSNAGPAPGATPQYGMPQGAPGQLPMAGPRGPHPQQSMPLQQPQAQPQQGQTAMPSNKFLQVIIRF